jgi:hypothetical protein
MLGIPPGQRPPAPHQLLDVSPDEPDCRILEEKAQRRIEHVRKYQLRHPEESSHLQNEIASALLAMCQASCSAQAKSDSTPPSQRACTATTVLAFRKTVVDCPAAVPEGTARKKASRRNPVLVEVRLAGVRNDERGTTRPDALAWELRLQAVRLTHQERTRLASRVSAEPAVRQAGQACVVGMQQMEDAGLGEDEILEVLRACLDALARSCPGEGSAGGDRPIVSSPSSYPRQ